jgi:gamma-glutamyl-gamma-aminobutyrate hydrolase PuuD
LTKRVMIVHTDPQYTRMFVERGWEIVTNLHDADLVQFTGGEDVSPSLYGQKAHATTWPNPNRDKEEINIFNQALEMAIPMAGICRGGQLLNVLNGGKMYQDVDNHERRHKAHLPGPFGEVEVSSTHHQMMIPSTKDEHIILLEASESSVRDWVSDVTVMRDVVNWTTSDPDVESIYYPETNSLCFQPHPEYAGYDACQEIYFYFVNNYLMDGGVEAEEIQHDLYRGHAISF